MEHTTAHTATFMLTDVVRSTSLREGAADPAGAAVSRHDELLDEAVSRHGGACRSHQEENEGVLAAFTRALDAVAAALELQCAFHCENWPNRESLKLRVALHTAQAQRHDGGNRFGRAISRCARL